MAEYAQKSAVVAHTFNYYNVSLICHTYDLNYYDICSFSHANHDGNLRSCSDNMFKYGFASESD